MMRRSHLRRSAISTVAIMSALVARIANAHPIHTTLTAVSQQQGEIRLSVRAFADDFSASVAVFAGRTPPADWVVTDSDASRYLASRIRVWDAAKRSLTLTSCGIRRERELYWLCLRVSGAPELRGLHLENRLLTERHEDQVNIVQVGVEGSRRTLLFTRKTDALELAR